MSSPRRSIIIFLLTAFLGFAAVGSFFTFPKEAHAQWIVSDLGNAAINTAKWTWERLKDAFAVIRKNFADVAYKNALKTYLTAVAEDTATWIASAGTGQKPLFITDPQYFSKLNDAAVGDFLDSLTRPTEIVDPVTGQRRLGSVFGQSLCDPGPIKIQLDLALRSQLTPNFALRSQLTPNFCQDHCNQNYRTGLQQAPVVIGDAAKNFAVFLPAAEAGLNQLRTLLQTGQQPDEVLCDPSWSIVQCVPFYTTAITNTKQKLQDDLKLCLNLCSAGRRKPKCTLTKIRERVGQLTPIEVTVNLPKIFKPSENPLGQFLTLLSEANKAAAKKVQQERDVASGQIGSITGTRSPITGQIKTPADLTRSQAQQSLTADPSGSAFGIYTGSPIADAIGVFTNTLTRKLIDRIYRCGINPATCFEGGGGTRASLGPGGGVSGGFSSSGIAAARASFSSSFTPDLADNTQIDILTDLQEKKLIDPGFRDAIGSGLTVLEATQTSPPKLDRNKPFGFSRPTGDLTTSVEPDAGSGYSYRSLIYLRKYRIIPVTWEIAAEYIGRNLTAPVTLGQLIDCHNDNVTESCKPFYRLVDPNWVLKVPALQCARKGFSEEIVPGSCHPEPLPPAIGFQTGGATGPLVQATVQVCQREETCVDDQSCVVESPDGKGCREWGYCTAEKPIWRFTGTGCDSQFKGCQTYISESGQEVSYVKDTLTTNGCNANNVGCQLYCRPGYCVDGAIPGATCSEDADCRGGGTCETGYDPANARWKNEKDNPGDPRVCTVESSLDKISLDRDAEQCANQDEGCSRFLRAKTGNLVRNPSFELHSAVDVAGGRENFAGWEIGGSNQTCGAQAFPDEGSLYGGTALKLQQLPVCAVGDPKHTLSQTMSTGVSPVGRTYSLSFSARSVGGACSGNAWFETGSGLVGTAPSYTADWQRYSFTHTFVDSARPDGFRVIFEASSACNVVFDGVQVEEAGSASSFKDYGVGNEGFLKEPPAYLGCTGNIAIDPAACSNYTLRCSAQEVGCERYTPIAGFVEPVNGTVTNPLSDVCISSNFKDPSCSQCPSQFVGCQAFQEVALTSGIPDSTNAVRTGNRCSNDHSRSCADDGDCDAPGICQPSLSIIPASGRRCSAADVGCEEYTNLDVVAKGGEGKEYYKQVRQCVNQSDPALRNFYSWEGSERAGFQLKLHRLKKSDADSGPCTNLAVSESANAACEDVARGIASCTIDPANPDCLRFYDDSGTTYDRLLSRTIIASDTCIPYRNTLDTNVYYFDGKLSRSCSAAAAGCREYKGNAGNNIRVVIKDDFEDGTNGGWVNGVNSTENLNFGGHSVKFTGDGAKDVAGLTTGKAYLLSFWAKTDPGFVAALTTATASFDTGESFGSVTLSGNWQLYTLGPTTITASLAPTKLVLSFGGGGTPYFDNITLTELSDSVYLIRNSYQFCQGYENCRAYQDRGGNTHFLKSFQSLCPAEKVGCEALIATQNSSSPFEEKFRKNPDRGDVNADGRIDEADVTSLLDFLFRSGPAPEPLALGDVNGDGPVNLGDTVSLTRYLNGAGPAPVPFPDSFLTVPEDRTTFLVNDPAKSCSSAAKGCKRLGVPKVDTEGNVSEYETVYRKDDPDSYATILCQGDQVGCGAFTLADTQGQAFFKDPGQRVCEYRENVGPGKVSGWFKTGTDESCPAASWTHLCPANQSSCSLYTAPTTYPNPVGGETNYHYLASTVPAGECPGGLDPKIGCLAFHLDSEASGNNTIRPNINPQDNTVLSQSCQLCNPNLKTCGRYGGAPCCTWGASTCSIEKKAGDDGIAPFYCLYENQDGNAGCQTTGGKVVRNDPTAPTNCGGVDQPVCFDCGSPGNPACSDPASDYKAADRACSDFSCSANTVLKVKRDRVCGEWLKCANQQVVTNDQGKQTTVCLERKLCKVDPGSTGTCTFVADNEFPHSAGPDNLTVVSPDKVDQLANITGYSRAGLAVAGKTIDGYLVYDQMSEEGLEGTDIEVPNGDFEAVQRTGTKAEVTDPPEKKAEFLWQSDNDAKIILDKVTPADNFASQSLRVVSGTPNPNGAFVAIDLDQFDENATSYFVSFDARRIGVLAKGIDVILRQKQGAAKVIVYQSSQLTLSDSWSRYIIELKRIPGAQLIETGSNPVEFVFRHFQGNLASEAFSLDNVSLKPVLKIQDNPTYVSRQCRSYPKDSAARCEFTDEQSGVKYRGWRGYCVERDPKDPKICLNWWPIDLISGEENIFGQSEQPFTRAPLYYCVEGLGNYVQASGNPFTTFTDKDVETGAGGVPRSPLLGTERGFQRPLGTLILGTLGSCKGSGSIMVDRCTTLGLHGICGGCAEDEIINGTFPLVPQAGYQDQYYESEMEKIEFILQRGSHADWLEGDRDTVVLNASNGWSAWVGEPGIWTSNSNVFAVKAIFDENRLMTQLAVFMTDGSPDNGGSWWAGIVHLRALCPAIIETVKASGKSVPWAGKISGTYLNHPLAYNSDTLCSPFGAAPVINSPNDIVDCGPVGKTFKEAKSGELRNGPVNGCQIIGGECKKLVDTDEGACGFRKSPLYLYSPESPSIFPDTNSICTETRLGNGMYSCSYSGTCRSCQKGVNIGLNCTKDDQCLGVVDPNPGSEGDLCTWQKVCIGGANDGRACEVGGDCASGVCDAKWKADPDKRAEESIGTPPADTPAENYPNKTTGFARLKQLFAKSYQIWSWNGTQYNPFNVVWQPPEDECKVCQGGPNAGKSCLVDGDCSPGLCRGGGRVDELKSKNAFCYVKPGVTNIKVVAGDKTYDSGKVVLSGTNRTVTLNFEPQPDIEQQPIRRITIDWGDGIPRSGYVGTSATKTYFCPQGASCVYTPTITVRDNWGKDSDAIPFNGTIDVQP